MGEDFKMEKTELTHIVHFEVNGGSPAIADQIVADNKKVKTPEDPEKEGFYFMGWYEDPEFGWKSLVSPSFKLSERITSDKTFYAGWGKWVNLTADSRQSFDENGKKIAPLANRSGYVYVGGSGARMMGIPVLAKMQTFSVKPEPGFHFVAWYKKKEDNSIGELISTETSFSIVLDEDINYYAIFEPDEEK